MTLLSIYGMFEAAEKKQGRSWAWEVLTEPRLVEVTPAGVV